MSLPPPLHDALHALEQTWREWDDHFARSLAAGCPSLAIAVEQTRCFARHADLLARERAMTSSLRLALVREGGWTPRQALDSCWSYPPNKCGHLIELLAVLPDELIGTLVDHTRGPEWRRHAPLDHPGVWVSKRAGGESLLVRLCERLVEMNQRSEAERLFAEIEHVGARIEALESLRALLSPDQLADALTETLARCRALDPIRRLYALCELSRLHPPAQALALVEEAIAGLPPGHGWCHTPGGLMMMLLAEPVIDALDRDGLREHLVAWADREGERLRANLLDEYAERLAAITHRPQVEPHRVPADDPRAWAPRALEQAEQGDPAALMNRYEDLPDDLIARAVECMQAVVREQPSQPWPVLILLRLAGRARALGDPCGESALAVVDEQLTSVHWHRYTYPEPIWCHPEFALLTNAARRRVLEQAVEQVRASASRLDLEREIAAVKHLRATPSSPKVELGARWLAGAREDGDGRSASERWAIARELWGAAALDALLAALEFAELPGHAPSREHRR